MTGIARRLRAAPGTQHALIAAITGYGGKEAQQRALKSGFDEFLVKPVDLDGLAKILKAADRKPIPK